MAVIRRRAEFDWSEVPYPDSLPGQADHVVVEDEHEPHTFLYVPDLANQTGWSTHRVPERRAERAARQPMGFRR